MSPTETLLCAQCGETSPREAAICAVCAEDPRLDGRYRLDALLGHGAMGVTYRATRLADGAVVAVKELPFRKVDSLKTTELFEREARVLRALSHPRIPTYFDDFVTGVGKQMALCLVQEFIDGATLDAVSRERRPDERAVLSHVADVLEILVYLADLRPPVVHRDIKPQNLMRRASDGSIVLIDFGSVRDVVRDARDGGSTVAGTFGYMAPEQFSGRAVPATDIYGLGATALALLTGRGADALLGDDGRLDWRERVPLSAGARRLLERMLDPDPERRPAARALLAEVRALLAAPEAVAAPYQPAAPNPAPTWRPRGAARSPTTGGSAAPAEERSSGLVTVLVGVAIAGIASALLFAAVSSEAPPKPIAVAESPQRPLQAVKGLSFGMTRQAAIAALPELAGAQEEPPERITAMTALIRTGGLTGAGDPWNRPESAVVPGTAWILPTTLGGLEATCAFRFGADDRLSAFKCTVPTDGPTEGVTRRMFEQWRSQYGAPRRDSLSRMQSGEFTFNHTSPFAHGQASWEDGEATLTLRGGTPITLEGETLAHARLIDELNDEVAAAARAGAARDAREKALKIDPERLGEDL